MITTQILVENIWDNSSVYKRSSQWQNSFLDLNIDNKAECYDYHCRRLYLSRITAAKRALIVREIRIKAYLSLFWKFLQCPSLSTPYPTTRISSGRTFRGTLYLVKHGRADRLRTTRYCCSYRCVLLLLLLLWPVDTINNLYKLLYRSRPLARNFSDECIFYLRVWGKRFFFFHFELWYHYNTVCTSRTDFKKEFSL